MKCVCSEHFTAPGNKHTPSLCERWRCFTRTLQTAINSSCSLISSTPAVNHQKTPSIMNTYHRQPSSAASHTHTLQLGACFGAGTLRSAETCRTSPSNNNSRITSLIRSEDGAAAPTQPGDHCHTTSTTQRSHQNTSVRFYQRITEPVCPQNMSRTCRAQ